MHREAKNRRNTLCISRFFNEAGRKICRQDGCGDLFSASLSLSILRTCLKSKHRAKSVVKKQENGNEARVMHEYPSDITREQFEIIREDLENVRQKTRPRKYDLYDIFCGVLYVLRGGIQWRMLPADYPKWQLVYYYFSVWSKPDDEGISLLDKLLKKIGQKSA